MFFKHMYDPDLAQGGFIIGCQASGEAIVVDGRRDVQTYLDEAAKQGLTITDVTETHIHADYLSGSREIAAATGARIWASDEGNEDWKYGFDVQKLYHGSEIKVGNVILRAVHTPGHTPEHLSFLVIDGATTDEPMAYLTGDFVFVGDVGRPDLLDEAAGGVDTRFVGAKQLFASLRDHFLALPDHIQVWPGHGAGSACGKSLGAVPSTTIGYERNTAWWSDYVKNNDEEGFTNALLDGQPDAPLYFGRMKRWNKQGPAVMGARGDVKELNADETAERLAQNDILFVDTRSVKDWHQDAVANALFIPYGGSFATYASYAIDPESDTKPIVVLAADAEQASDMRDKLAYTGIDNFAGFVTSLTPFEREAIPTVNAQAFKAAEKDAYVLDVRTANEFHGAHVEGAHQLHAGRVRWHLADIPKDAHIITHCEAGGRAAVAASVLRHHGYDNVTELAGGFSAYRQAHTSA